VESSDRAKILELLDEGHRLVRELLKENDELRLREAELSEKNDALQQGTASGGTSDHSTDDRPRQELEGLNKQKKELETRLTVVEEENREFAERYLRVEQQNSDLISLYMATNRLHSTLDYDNLLNVVKEIVIDLVGAEVFGIYLLNDPCSHLILEAHEGMHEGGDYAGRTRVAVGADVVGHVAATGLTFIRQEAKSETSEDQPVVCIPLMVDDQVIGVVAVFALLTKKDSFPAGDYELFALFGAHVATALFGARMYTLSERKRATLEGFVDLVKKSSKLVAP
jgi:putative methionine-R-sulfoxide reductase with GAF domain